VNGKTDSYQLVKNFPPYIQTPSSLSCFQEPVTELNPNPVETNPFADYILIEF
jgi:hypothetical protein